MLSRLNLLVTVATLFVVSVCGTAVSHAGQARQVGDLCFPGGPVFRDGQAVGDRQTNLVFTPPQLSPSFFRNANVPSLAGTRAPGPVPGEVTVPQGQGEFRYSLCEGRVLAADEVSRSCTRQNLRVVDLGPPAQGQPNRPNLGCIVQGGNNASFVFAVPPGQTLPEGVSIDGFGILHVQEDARLAQTDIRVCVRQLNVNDSCQNIGLNQVPAVTPAAGVNAANVIVPVAVAGGAGIGTYILLKNYLPGFGSGGSCTPPSPSPAQVCFGGNAGGSACQTALSQQDAFCKCSGFGGFNVNTGGCQ